jgi:hypothetical protein
MWFFGELSAHLPFKRNGAPHHTEAPLYNRWAANAPVCVVPCRWSRALNSGVLSCGALG